MEMLRKRLKVKYPDATDDELDKLASQNDYLRLKTYTECLAKMKVAIYIGESSNDYLLDMLQAEDLMTDDERNQRYKLGANIENSSITETIRKQKEEKNEKDERE